MKPRVEDIATLYFSTPSFNPRPFNPGVFYYELSNPRLFNPSLFNGLKGLGLKSPELKYPLSISLKDISTPDFFNHRLFLWLKKNQLIEPFFVNLYIMPENTIHLFGSSA